LDCEGINARPNGDERRMGLVLLAAFPSWFLLSKLHKVVWSF